MVSGALYGADWPQYKRDSARTGNAPEEILSFPMQMVMGIRLPSPIYASPAVVDGKVYIQDSRGRVVCADSRKNKVLWKADIGGAANHSSPAVLGGRVFVGSSAGYLAVLDAVTGRSVGNVKTDGGVIAAPAVANNAVYFVSMNGYVYKTDYNGKVLWNHKFAKACNVEMAVQGTKIAVLSNTCTILEDKGTGVQRFCRGPKRSPTGGPVFVDKGRIVFQNFDSENGSLAVIEITEKRGRMKKHFSDHNDSRVTPSFRDGICYRGDIGYPSVGRQKAVWRADCPDMQAGGFHSSPALAKNHCVVGSERGHVYFFPLLSSGTAPGGGRAPRGGKKVKPVWSFATLGSKGDVNQAVSSSPAVSNGRVFFGGEDGILYGLGKGRRVRVVDLKPDRKNGKGTRRANNLEWHTVAGDMGYSGVSPDRTIKPPFRIKWRTRIWSTFKSGLVIADGMVFGASRMGQLTALDSETGEILWRTLHPYGESRPAPIYSEGKLCVMRGVEDQHWKSNESGGVWCHDAKTGKLLWRKPLDLGYHFNADGLVADKEKCFVFWNGGKGAVEGAALRLEDGRPVWQRRYEKLLPSDKSTPIRHATALGDGLLFFAVGHSETLSRKRHIKEEFGATMAVDPRNGNPVWLNTKYRLIRGSRISFRNGILVVFSPDGCHALNAKTGKHLWSSEPPDVKKLHWGHYYMNALSNEFLNSKGQRGLLGYVGCSYPIYINGLWYGHSGSSTPTIVAWEDTPSARGGKGHNQRRIVWRHDFLSNACPSPSPAYGRLYYSPNGEGVVYCFEPGK